ncbi:MAG TPA: hypothetical protein VFY93_02125 [Planctomycetota bacterium]|nr:hypothetical protein [Planctomycetota bacterium]
MLIKGYGASVAVAVALGLGLAGCGNSSPFSANIQRIAFLTETIPPAEAGRLYNVVIAFASEGGAAPPDRFELAAGVLPTGVSLFRDQEDLDLDGVPDVDGAYTGNARLLGVPREPGSYSFTIKAISTGRLAPGGPNPDQPDLAASHLFSVNVSEGSVAILTPTAEEGTTDPAMPAFPAVVPFVNPANPEAFFSFAFQIAGGSDVNAATIYGPREWELSAFDTSVVDEVTLRQDVDESSVPGAPANLSKFEQNFADGGIFVLQAGQKKVQLGGFQSPRGSVRVDGPDGGEDITSSDPAFLTGLLPDWFQDAAVPKNSRRDLADTLGLAGGDDTLGTEQPVLFSDYFDPGFKSTTPTPDTEAKYPFTEDQYLNAFFVPYTVGVDLTPLMFRLIVEAVDTRGTATAKSDDVITRKAFVVRVQIPDVTVDTMLLPAGQAGVLYDAQVLLSGGVPPLFTDLEWVDSTNDLQATAADPLTKGLFGVEIDPKTWWFIGAPRAAAPDTDPATPTPDGPTVELTVRAWAQVMNPTQSGPALVPTGNAGEWDGLLDPDGAGPAPGKPGRHRTYQVNFALPTSPAIVNQSIKPGIDGQAYPGDRIVGVGGVPLLAPYPPGFFEGAPGVVYPSATAQRSYEWSSTYAQDASYGAANPAAPGLPNSLTLVTSAALATNGNITGTTLDRGFLDIHFQGRDFDVGNVAVEDADAAAYQTVFEKTLTLSVSPDQAVYMRGVQASEGAGGVTTGLLDSTAQMATPLMTPILLAAGLFTVETGKTPVYQSAMPAQFDILPVLLPNGGSDAHNRKSIPSVSGYWPAESNKEPYWRYTGVNEAWKHSQQELTWLQAPNPAQSRVFMWAEATILNNFVNGTWTQRFQTLDSTKRRGVLVVNPDGEFFIPAILDGTDAAHGTHFGAEAVTPGGSTGSTSSYYYYGSHPMYTRYYYYSVRDSQIERRVHMQGTSTYLEPYSSSTNTSNGWYMGSLGRTATSIAMSANGIWCATALPGGSNAQKILLWRTDKQEIPAAILSQTYATSLTGKQVDATGALVDFPNSACILTVGGEQASGVTIAANQRYLLPDSLMFVQDGLLFLNETQFDRVFGVSLVDGHLSSADLNSASAVNGAGNGPGVRSTTGWYIPDNDYLRGAVAPTPFSAQFAYTGSRPQPGEEGPAHVAFVAGANAFVGALSDLSGYPRAGYAMHGNRDKTLFYLALNTASATGLDLASSTLRDLTGNNSTIYGDLLTPGRFGEELDFLALSDDGNYAAVVREVSTSEGSTSFSYQPSFHTGIYYVAKSSTYVSWGPANHDLMLVSTNGSDMHSGTGSQHVLYLGTAGPVPSKIDQSDPTGLPAYAVGKNHINAYSRRVNGLTFTPDNRNLIFNYAGSDGNYSSTTYGLSNGTSTGWGPINPAQTGTFSGGTQVSIRLNFRTSTDAPVDFTSTSNLSNNLQGLTGTSGVGKTTAPFSGDTGAQCFWATFKSDDGNFLYYISDQIDASTSFTSANRNYMVGFNISGATINGRSPFTPFSPHANTIGFEQFDCNAWNYENRFKSVPGGAFVGGRDGAGILCVIASDASAGAGSATDLEVYVMNANLGTNLLALTSGITSGTANAINHLAMSADGNVLAGQVAKTTTNSNGSRATLNSNTDLFVVTNLHEVLAGGTPNALVVSQGQSHGTSVAFIGEGTGSGPQSIVYSSGSPGTSNTTWATRTLKSVRLTSGAIPIVLDATQSHTVVLAGGRRLNDDPATAD